MIKAIAERTSGGQVPPHGTFAQALWCIKASGEFATTDPVLAHEVINYLRNSEIPYKVRRTKNWTRIVQVEANARD